MTDAGGLTRTEPLTIAVTNQNEAPTDITVAGGTVQENAAAGTVVAKLGAADPDAGDSFSYALAADPSGKFELVGDEIRLKAGATLDYETASSHQLTVAVTDAGGLTRTEPLTIAVTNQNEAPTDITVAGGTVQENAAAGTVVAKLGAADPDAGDSFSYALAADPSGKFELVGDEIRLKAGATPRLRDGQLASAHRGRDRRGRPDPHRAADHRRHQSERGPHRHHGRRRHGAGERGGRHGGGQAGGRRPGRGRQLHLCAGRRSLGQVRAGRRRDPAQGRRHARLRDGQLAPAHRGRDRRGRPDPHRAADHRRHQSERGPDRHHGRRRHGAGECAGRHGGGQAGGRRPGRGRQLHLCAAADPSGKFELVGDEIRLKAGATPRLRDGQLASAHRDRDRRRRPDPHRAADHRRHQSIRNNCRYVRK